jgi:hypothetical protein
MLNDVRIDPSSRFGNCRTVATIPRPHEQTFLTHPGEVAARNADVGQVFCPDFTLLKSQRDGPFPQCRLWATGKPNPFGSVAITLPHPDKGLWRSIEGNRQLKVRSFVQPGEPNFSRAWRECPPCPRAGRNPSGLHSGLHLRESALKNARHHKAGACGWSLISIALLF